MKRSLLIFAVTLCALTACKSDRTRLTEVNEFLNENRLDTAQYCLNRINPVTLSKENKALYQLVSIKLNHLRYRPVPTDSLILSCVRYFKRKGNNDKLAESLFYKAVGDYEAGRVKEAFVSMREAEHCAAEITDLTVRHKIIECLTDWNMSEGQYPIALSYAKRNLEISTLGNNYNWIAYALAFLSQIYEGLGAHDSSRVYLDKCISYLHDVPDSARVDFYNYTAALKIRTDPDAARRYAMQGNAIRENSVGYATLAQIRFRDGDTAAADSLCRQALMLATTPTERIYVLRQTMLMQERQGRFVEAYQTSRSLMDEKDEEAQQRERHDVRSIQLTYDYELRGQRYLQILYMVVFLVVVIVFLVILLILRHRYRMSKADKEAMQNQLLINIYSQQVEQLKSSKQDMQSVVDGLTEKITSLRERQSKMLYEGRRLYEEILQGGTTSVWGKTEFAHFIEYYKLIDLPFVTHLENDYDNLSPRNMFFEVLYHMGKDDQEVARVLGVGNSTVRSSKTRIKKKKV